MKAIFLFLIFLIPYFTISAQSSSKEGNKNFFETIESIIEANVSYERALNNMDLTQVEKEKYLNTILKEQIQLLKNHIELEGVSTIISELENEEISQVGNWLDWNIKLEILVQLNAPKKTTVCAIPIRPSPNNLSLEEHYDPYLFLTRNLMLYSTILMAILFPFVSFIIFLIKRIHELKRLIKVQREKLNYFYNQNS